MRLIKSALPGMNFGALAIVCMATAFSMSIAHADDTLTRANNQVTVSVGGQYLDYTESIAARDPLDTEKGTLTAFRLGAVRQGEVFGISNIYLSGAINRATGTTSYDGYLQNRSTGALTPYKMKTSNEVIDISLKAGRAFEITQNGNAQLVPYIAYGYRYWNRDSSADRFGYVEKYTHHSASAGLLGQYAITPKLVANADASVGTTFGAKMTANFVPGTFDLGSKPIVSASFGLDYALTQQVHVNGNYQVTQFRYGQSNVVNGYFEPYSKTTQQIVSVGIGYAF